MIWLLVLFALFIPSLAEAACTGSSPTYTCSCEVADLRALFISDNPGVVHENDTINVNPGTCDWNQQLIIGEAKAVPGFSFVGAGEGVTVFRRGASYSEAGSPFSGMIVVETLATSGLTILTGFTIDTNSSASTPTQGYVNMLGAGLDRFRVHHVTIENLKTKGFTAYGNRSGSGALEFSGLFDHMTCNTATSGSATCFYVKGTWNINCCAGNQNQFLFAPALGSNHSVYVEDSICNYAATSDDCFDSYAGGSIVFRYNTSNFGLGGAHGADSGLRGNRQMEIYRNTVTAPPIAHYVSNFRSGPSVEFDNVATSGTFAYSSIVFTLQRPIDPSMNTSPRFLCNGSSLWDKNLGSGTLPTGNPGWPCLDQTGWFFTGVGPNGTNAIYTPAYFWNNKLGASTLTYTKNDQATSQATNYITADRDYYFGGITAQTSSSSPFDGTTGVGFGTLARRPATCTTGSLTTNGGVGGVGYWATDQGSWNVSGNGDASGLLYKCTATNIWTLSYTPYTYPHPLQGATPAVPTSPTGLRVVGASTGTSCTVVWTASQMAGLLGYHIYTGTSTGVYGNPIVATPATAAAAHTVLTQRMFQFPVAGTYYITVTSFSADVQDSAAATEVTCTSTGFSRTAAGTRATRN
jgi:hypothetical protein